MGKEVVHGLQDESEQVTEGKGAGLRGKAAAERARESPGWQGVYDQQTHKALDKMEIRVGRHGWGRRNDTCAEETCSLLYICSMGAMLHR